MFFRRYPADAGCGAFTDIPEQALALAPLGPREVSFRARSNWKDFEEYFIGISECPGIRVGAEVFKSGAFLLAGNKDSRKFILHGNCKVWIRLIVFELHVISWLILLDPRKFQSQRFEFGSNDRPINTDRFVNHAMCLARKIRTKVRR